MSCLDYTKVPDLDIICGVCLKRPNVVEVEKDFLSGEVKCFCHCHGKTDELKIPHNVSEVPRRHFVFIRKDSTDGFSSEAVDASKDGNISRDRDESTGDIFAQRLCPVFRNGYGQNGNSD